MPTFLRKMSYARRNFRILTDPFPRSTLEQYYPSILNVLLNRLQNTKTEPFASRFVRLYHFISAKDDKGLGADFFISKLDQVQEGYAFVERSSLIYFRSALTRTTQSLCPPLPQHHPSRHTETLKTPRSKNRSHLFREDFDRVRCLCKEVQERLGVHL